MLFLQIFKGESEIPEQINEEPRPVYKAILSRRAIRRFQQKPISTDILKRLVNAGRIAPSAANFQPLEYAIVYDKERCAQVFETIGWAGYIRPKWTPDRDERPVAYIIILVRKNLDKYYKWDVGLSAENIMLAAEEENIGSCILLNIKRDQIRNIFSIPESHHIDAVIALGFKKETSVMEELKDSVEYWRDKDGVLHVPKRKLEDILHINKF